MTFSPDDFVWTEKYRPKTVKNLIGKEIREKILKYLENPETMPNFIFVSKHAGTGKTSLAKAIINDLKCDKLILNSSDDRTLEVVRDKVKEFAKTKSLDGKKKCIFLDESDGLHYLAADALRNIMETYASNVFFILSCNALNKIPEPIQSRCTPIHFSYPDKEEVKNYIIEICNFENIDYADEGVEELIKQHYPSIRNMVLVLQELKTLNQPLIPTSIKKHDEIFEVLWKAIKDKDYKTVREKILSSDIDPREFNTFIWFKYIEEDNNSKLQICAQNELAFAYGADPKIIFSTSLTELIK